ncbi:hypothetical protein I6J77_09825 [Rhodanobacter sp. FDAARGOS 1247]|jgi:hypothetical protein|uniref:papain-like cysteine protease family protein n=1 Tax=Rhodanobacter sp. FDAARGOS 1247 TaxID=2778082 RepID=UPI0019524023|nr:papain-like cysteine protease family protein [Rhodanobacter sp. FDAARGOS 1247]QRP62453.1 hypothetical protein I6J77_09825 [Rhodanobacter sp. FDAARGOS 1247]
MTYRVNGVLDMHFQGLNLNCGLYCLEALMRNRHGTKYGAVVTVAPAFDGTTWRATYGAARTAHDQAVQAHIDEWFKIAFDPDDHAAAYGLVNLAKPASALGWENALRAYGPLVVSGHIGAVRIIPMRNAGHFVLVIGVSASGKIVYLDPLRPLNAFNMMKPRMSVAQFNNLSDNIVAAAA